MKLFRVAIITAVLLLFVTSKHSFAASESRSFDRARLPAALQNVPLEKLSSGALYRLDQGGDLVRPPLKRERASSGAATENAPVALDQRVGKNIRLGDDPSQLPDQQRAQAEPHIARAVNDADFLLATFQEGRFTDGGGLDCGFSVTHDGGLTWSRALIPNLTQTSGGTYFRATDPVAAIALDGTAYLNTIGALDSQFNTGEVVISRSTDGGATFAAPVRVFRGTNGAFADKNWMAVNNFAGTSHAGRVIVTFTLFLPNRASPIERTYSDDKGSTWSTATVVNGASSATQGSQPVFLPNGNVAIPYCNFGPNRDVGGGDDTLQVVLSTDGGTTFGAPKTIAGLSLYSEPAIRTGDFLPAATTDRTTNSIYLVYQALLNNSPRILFTKSSDGGNTWSAPIAISDNPANSGVFNPTIAASPDGQTLTATFYDHRDNPGSTTLVDLYLAQSFDGGATWQPNIRVSSVTTDASLAPQTSSGYMLGDYLGIAPATSSDVPAVPVWIDTRTGNPDPFIARVGIAPAVNFTSWQAARLSLGQINDPQLGGEAGDVDHDGEDNLSEFRSGTDPQDPLSVLRTGRQVNISTRAFVQTGDHVLIGGFIITGADPKKVITRAIGPSLSSANVAGPLQDPTLELFDQNGGSLAFNNDWKDSQESDIAATTLQPTDERESAIVRTLAPGSYTAVVRGNHDDTGVALVEVYDLTPTENSRLGNISSRGFVGSGDYVMIGGFIVGAGQGSNGAGSERVVVRGIGPSLAQSGVNDPLLDPELVLADSNGNTIAQNDGWKDTQRTELEGTGLAPSDDREAAIVTALPGGNYTAIVRGKNGATGVASVEAYNVQ